MSKRNGCRVSAFAWLLILTLSSQALPQAFASVTSGSPCSKIGATTVSNKVKYQCVSSGKKKIWKIAKVVKPTPAKIDDFSAFACNPYDERLKNFKLPAGDSLEIRASAACLALSFIENPTSKSKINLSLSPNFQPVHYKTIERSVQAADRIFGHLGYSGTQKIEVFGSDDADWLCSYGAKIYSGRSNVSWENMPDSGCNGNTQGRARADVVDAGKTPVLWFLTSPQALLEPNTGKYQSWPETLQQFGHELAHATMFQITDFSNSRYVEHPGGWYPEGQAQYLDLGIAWLEFGDLTWRERLIAAGKRDAAQYFPNSQVSFEALNQQNKDYGQAMYSLGALASEYLIAHYGLKTTFDWYTTWSAPGCQSPRTQSCWIERAAVTLKISPEQLFSELDIYVNKQLGIRYSPVAPIEKPVVKQECLGKEISDNKISRSPIGLEIAESARNCVVYHWLNNQEKDASKVKVFSDVTLSSQVQSRALNEAIVGLSFYKGLLSDPDTEIKIIMATNPIWTCKFLTDELTGSDQEDYLRTLKGTGCLGTTVANGHSWDGWETATCDELNRKVNLPFFARKNGKPIAYVVLSRCASVLKSPTPPGLNITRKLAQSFFAQLGGSGFRRYLFESGWQEIVGQYGQGIFFENSANMYPDTATKSALTTKEDLDYLASLNGKFTPISELPDEPSNYPNFNVWRLESNIAAEYLIGTYGVAKSLEILIAWEKSKSAVERANFTVQLTGLSESDLFAKIDVYIKLRTQ
jgi:hypothetical protein